MKTFLQINRNMYVLINHVHVELKLNKLITVNRRHLISNHICIVVYSITSFWNGNVPSYIGHSVESAYTSI